MGQKERRRRRKMRKPQGVFSLSLTFSDWTYRESFCSRPLHLWGLQAGSLISTNKKKKTQQAELEEEGQARWGRQMPDSGPGRWGLMNPEKEELKLWEVAKRPTVIIAESWVHCQLEWRLGQATAVADGGGPGREREGREGGRKGGAEGPWRFPLLALTSVHCGYFSCKSQKTWITPVWCVKVGCEVSERECEQSPRTHTTEPGVVLFISC